MSKEILVACDGSCLVNPGGATGWAWVTSDGRWSAGCQPTGTNQVAELWGVLSVLRDFPMDPLVVQIDSEYAMNATTKWVKGWERRGWVNSQGKPVANLKLIKTIYSMMRQRTEPIRFVKVPGHDPENRWPLNTAADKRARAAASFANANEETQTFYGTDESVPKQIRRAQAARSRAS